MLSQFTCVGDVSMSSAFGCVCFTVLEDLSISEVCGFDSNCLIRSFTGIAFSKFSLLNYKLPILSKFQMQLYVKHNKTRFIIPIDLLKCNNNILYLSNVSNYLISIYQMCPYLSSSSSIKVSHILTSSPNRCSFIERAITFSTIL